MCWPAPCYCLGMQTVDTNAATHISPTRAPGPSDATGVTASQADRTQVSGAHCPAVKRAQTLAIADAVFAAWPVDASTGGAPTIADMLARLAAL